MKILVLDAESRAALQVIRSLGRAGHEVVALSHQKRALGFSSRYTAGTLICPSPRERGDLYRSFLLEELLTGKAGALLPVAEGSLRVILEEEWQFRARCILPFPTLQNFEIVTERYDLMKLARSVQIAVPSSVEIVPSAVSAQDLSKQLDRVRFPATARPLNPNVRVNDHAVKPNLKYLTTPKEAHRFFAGLRESVLCDIPHFVESRLQGERISVSALCYQGEPILTFAERTLIESPSGVSILSEGIELSEAPVGPALRLLRELQWDGFGTVQFRRTAAGEVLLDGMSPIFSPTVQLAVDSGVDLPRYLIELASCSDDEAIQQWARGLGGLSQYTAGRRLRWGFGSLDFALSQFKGDSAFRRLFRENALKVRGGTRFETLRLSDYRPGIVEFENRIGSLFKQDSKR